MGLNYIKQYKDGTTEATLVKPSYGVVSTTGDYLIDGLWYDLTGTLYSPQFTYLSKDGKLLVVEVVDGSPIDIHYDEDAPSIVEDCIKADVMISDEYKGKNACTAWVNFDGTTTPPTIIDSFNINSVVRTSTGIFDIYFEEDMDKQYSATISYEYNGNGNCSIYGTPLLNKLTILTMNNSGNGMNSIYTTVHIFGGKN